jgi:hypothetical protein
MNGRAKGSWLTLPMQGRVVLIADNARYASE